MHTYEYPSFDNIDLTSYELPWGFYTLGFLKAHRPDCEFITPDQIIANSQETNDYEWLNGKIQNILNNHKKVCIVVWDESTLGDDDLHLSTVLNKYKNDPVWLITQLDPLSQLIYSYNYNIQCKIVELPWFYLNECLTYYQLTKKIKSTTDGTYNYMSLVGRPQKEKLDLIEKLKEHNLTKFGFITLPKRLNNNEYKIEPNPPYKIINNSKVPKFGAQFCHGGIWASCNVENFLYLETEYQAIPMVVHGDTTCGIFFSTEKSLWPLLLGKLMIVYGRPGVMASVQRFYDINFSEYLNMEFDQQDEYSEAGHDRRLETLVKNNQEIIKNCKEIFTSLSPRLESARWTLGRNIYKFFIQQLDTIY